MCAAGIAWRLCVLPRRSTRSAALPWADELKQSVWVAQLAASHAQASLPTFTSQPFTSQPFTSRLQVGPRACLQPIKMFAGSFGGPVIYENAAYVSPNTVRALFSVGLFYYFLQVGWFGDEQRQAYVSPNNNVH